MQTADWELFYRLTDLFVKVIYLFHLIMCHFQATIYRPWSKKLEHHHHWTSPFFTNSGKQEKAVTAAIANHLKHVTIGVTYLPLGDIAILSMVGNNKILLVTSVALLQLLRK